VYESGDDILEPFMASKLDFDMRVPGAKDAHFKHLFTGDEQRYKVILNAVNEAEEVELYWQGYLLPDLYSEIYRAGNLFVPFAAIDMIASLKGKTFKPWEYFRRKNIMEVIAEIMAFTGISQPFVVMPSVVPDALLFSWRDINVDLEVYAKDGGEDLYTILKDLLQSNLMTMRSFRGQWVLEGVTRKTETIGNAYRFDAAGTYIGFTEETRNLKTLQFVKDSLFFTAITPWKSVDLKFNNNNETNLLPEDVVEREAFFGIWNQDKWDKTSMKTSYIDYWTKQSDNHLEFEQANHVFRFRTRSNFVSQPYQINEAASLARYFECKEKPFLYPGVEYKLECEVKVMFQISGWVWGEENLQEIFDTDWRNGNAAAEKSCIIQLLFNGVEFASNRPTATGLPDFKWVKTAEGREVEGTFNYAIGIYKIERFFEVDEEGEMIIRFLAPITNDLMTLGYFRAIHINPRVLKITIENSEAKGLKAVRDINFTQVLDYDLAFISSADNSIKKNFAIGKQQLPYSRVLPVGDQTLINQVHSFPNGNDNQLVLWGFGITAEEETILFKQLRSKSIFITRADGAQDFFNSLYTNRNGAAISLYYLNDVIGRPKYPKNYKKTAKVEAGDVITILLSIYGEEDFEIRKRWKIWGQTEIKSFLQTCAQAIHSVRPTTIYALEGSAFELLFPGEVAQFYFDEEIRDFVPTRLTLDLVNGKTEITAREMKFEPVNDISYE
jgi:hypothetical protein